MIYGMEDNNEFALVAKPQLNMKKIYLMAGIIIVALVLLFVFFLSGSDKETTSGEDFALNSGEEYESNPILYMPGEAYEEEYEEQPVEEEPQIQNVRLF